jgi:hypothetical protein
MVFILGKPFQPCVMLQAAHFVSYELNKVLFYFTLYFIRNLQNRLLVTLHKAGKTCQGQTY